MAEVDLLECFRKLIGEMQNFSGKHIMRMVTKREMNKAELLKDLKALSKRINQLIKMLE